MDGVKIRMDDFQSQFDESMMALRDFIDFLKIDAEFLAELNDSVVKPDVIVEAKPCSG